MFKRFRLVVTILLIGTAVVLWQQQRPWNFSVTFFDIGQGDAHLIKTPAHQTILIDGGPNRTILRKLGSALPWTTRTIDLMILSHPHADHVTGLIEVLKRYKVKQVVATWAAYNTPEYATWQKIITDKKIPLLIAQAGQNLELADGVKLTILWPTVSMAGVVTKDVNFTSIVNKICWQATCALFTGDTPKENEQELLSLGANLKAQILKVAHQGSRTSSSEDFLRAVAPEVAVIPVGENNYGHPHTEVVERLQRLVRTVLRTDQVGDITFVSNGESWYVP